jgi:glycerophosphoryl diester phosphodiesterase
MKTTLAFAHRGWHEHAVENSMAAMDAAYAAGCDGVEFDVQLTSDGVPVLFHDDDLMRLGGKSGEVHAMAWPELRGLKLGQNGKSAAMPTLEDFLGHWGDRPFYLELKVAKARYDDAAYLADLFESCAGLLGQTKLHPQTFMASFHWEWMKSLVGHGSSSAGAEPFQRIAPRPAFSKLGVIYEDEPTFDAVLRDTSLAEALKIHSLEYGLYAKRVEQGLLLPPKDRLWVWGLHGEMALRRAFADGLGGVVADDVPGMLRVRTAER